MSLSFLLLLFLSHLILSAWAQGEKRLAPKGQPGPAATGRNPGGVSSSRSSSSTKSSSSSSAPSSSGASLGSQGSGLEQSSFQWSPSGRRTGSLYCRVGIGFHLQIYPDGKVNGSHEANTLIKTPLNYIEISQFKQAKFTDDCKFRERFQENSYNTYASAIHRTEKTGREWYVALNKRGKAKRGCSPRVKPQHISTHFLPRFKQSEQPELSFTVTAPEKKKPPNPIKPKVPLSAPRRSPNTVKYRLKFRFG
ncbi:hypothetical protein E2I00_008452 [Balaenoptera physalus]|uniref:Uncharacterized protein n=1 Tax=Balaenoptera physalus TaxID=9770 RepID=A0A6A1Q508_BALPH|nr:hypothetical protein E2I00_008452 [Balaenoptera physalus]